MFEQPHRLWMDESGQVVIKKLVAYTGVCELTKIKSFFKGFFKFYFFNNAAATKK